MSKEAGLTIKLPELGEGVTEGELIKWLVSKGDFIEIDQPVAEVMTDKASMEVPSPLNGIVESLFAKEGESVQVGDILLKVKAQETKEKKSQKKNTQSDLELSESVPQLKKILPVKSLDKSASFLENDIKKEEEPKLDTSLDGVLATPMTRRLARELGVDLSRIPGTGLAGRVTKEDVLKYSDGKPVPAHVPSFLETSGVSVPREGDQTRTPLKGVRKKIADKMQLSKKVIPHFTLLESADVGPLDKVKSSVKEMLKEKEIKITYLSFVMKALLHTIKEFPMLNASIDDVSKEVVIKKYYNIGFAVDTPRGLLVPVIKDVDKKSLSEVSFEIQTLAEKARTSKIQPEDMKGGTITITNIGSLGGEYATPIINPPEVAILGMYRVYIKPHWDGSTFKPQKTMNFSLTCDHRLIDGAVSAKVLKSFIYKIENPLSLFV